MPGIRSRHRMNEVGEACEEFPESVQWMPPGRGFSLIYI